MPIWLPIALIVVLVLILWWLVVTLGRGRGEGSRGYWNGDPIDVPLIA